MKCDNNKIVGIFYFLFFILIIVGVSLFINVHYLSRLIFFFSLLLAIITFFILDKFNLNRKIKFLVILTTLFFSGIFIEIWQMFVSFPTIAITDNYSKAQAIQKYIEQKCGSFAEIQDFKNEQFLTLHTYSHIKFDKIAIAIADSDLFDDSVRIGVYYQPSDDIIKSKKRFENAINNRIKLIRGVKDVETSIYSFPKNSKENSGINKIEINITTKENADNAKISKIINNFLPEKYFQISIIFNN